MFCLPKHREKEKEGNFPETQAKAALTPLAAGSDVVFPLACDVYILLPKASSLDTVPADLEPGLWLNPSKAETSKHY